MRLARSPHIDPTPNGTQLRPIAPNGTLLPLYSTPGTGFTLYIFVGHYACYCHVPQNTGHRGVMETVQLKLFDDRCA